jgi:non-homologous end joining protein Ku
MATRTFATVFLKIGPLVEVELAVYSTLVSDHGVKRNQYTRDGNPVGNQNYDKVSGAVVTRDDIVKKIATEHGPVYVEDHEIEDLFHLEPNSLVIKGYNPQHMLYGGDYVAKSALTVEAAKKKVGSKKVDNATGQVVLSGLLTAMAEEGVVAICELTTRGVPKPAALLPDGTLWLLAYTDEVREPRPRPEVEVPEAVVDQLRAFVQPSVSTEAFDLTDRRTASIQEFADAKALAGDFGEPDAPEIIEAREALSGTTDLVALLGASLQAAGVGA